jgi:hypothetical protein
MTPGGKRTLIDPKIGRSKDPLVKGTIVHGEVRMMEIGLPRMAEP